MQQFFCLHHFTARKDLSKDQLILEYIIEITNSSHFSPADINDSFSVKVYNLYLKDLDEGKRFFTQEDIKHFGEYKYSVDDEIKNGSFDFFNEVEKIYSDRVSLLKDYTKEILAQPIDFKVDENIDLNEEKANYANDLSQLKNSWRKYLKFQVLEKLASSMDIQEKAREKKDTLIKVKSFYDLEAESRKSVVKTMDEWFRRIAQFDQNDRKSMYFNCIANCFDPHTEFFAPKEKEDFDISMSGTLEGIGATLQEKDGYTKVAGIVPGSPSWKEGELKEGDIIIKVAQGAEEAVDIVGMRLDNAVKLIRGKKGTEVRLTVKKLDGTIKVISIIRDIVIIEETYAKSIILGFDNKKDEKYGYIKLPSFYADFNNKDGRRCSDDIKKELQKLKKEDVKGLILDLRFNGGGSLEDVVDIAGYFIKSGPVVQVKSRLGMPYVLADRDESVEFDKPLVVLVNLFSASASEIFAAAMQDYKRGVIIGSSSTYGKGTVQRFFDLDEIVPYSYSNFKPFGSLKVTIQKFYRINGESTQLKGVVPDIILPDNYDFLKIGEKDMDNAMPWNMIQPVEYELWKNRINYTKIKDKSSERVSKSQFFTLENENVRRLKRIDDEKSSPLNLEKYRNKQKQLTEEAKKYSDIEKEISQMKVMLLMSDQAEFKSDTSKVARMQAWQKSLKKDSYIFEALNVLSDLQ